MDKEKLIALLGAPPNKEPQWVDNSSPATLLIDKQDVVEVCQRLWHSADFFFDQLSCITGLDNGPESATLEVIYTLYSIPFNQSLMLKVVLPRAHGEVESISTIWKSANWMEREIFDLYGIQFLNHPDLRRILMPADWDGHPLRKDYREPDSYRNIKLAPES